MTEKDFNQSIQDHGLRHTYNTIKNDLALRITNVIFIALVVLLIACCCSEGCSRHRAQTAVNIVAQDYRQTFDNYKDSLYNYVQEEYNVAERSVRKKK